MKITKILIIVVLIGVGAFVLMSRSSGDKIVSPTPSLTPSSTPSPTPTPIPIIIDQNTDLETETEGLAPKDFSGDFKLLKEEAGKL